MLHCTHLRTGCASLLRGTGMPPAEGALGLGKPLRIPVAPAGLVRVVLLTLLAGTGEPGFWAARGPGEELLCISCTASGAAAEPCPWLLNAFTGCRRARGDGAAGERNLLGEGTGKIKVQNNHFHRKKTTQNKQTTNPVKRYRGPFKNWEYRFSHRKGNYNVIHVMEHGC